MFIRAYLRASTKEQDAERAKQQLVDFVKSRDMRIASYYTENESGASLHRPELFRLLSDSEPGDILLVEQVDRLSRLTEGDWQKLRNLMAGKGLLVVALDLPTSHQFLSKTGTDEFSSRMIAAINNMMMDMLAAVARKDYEDRRRRQAQGIEKAKSAGVYRGKGINKALHQRINDCLVSGMRMRQTAKVVGCALSTVQRAKAMAEPSK